MSAPFFSDDKGNKIFGKEDDTIKSIKNSASLGAQKGVDRSMLNSVGGSFPAPIIHNSPINGSLGDWLSTTPLHFLPYPGIEAKTGFTLPEYTDYEYISFDNSEDKDFNDTPDEKVDKKIETYDYFEDYSSKQFTHLLDYFIDQTGGLGDRRTVYLGAVDSQNNTITSGNTKDIYLGSFIRTIEDNEDPTILGYDLTIKWNESPLFNGTIDTFISQLVGYGNSEIGSRKEILDNFKKQFVKFFKTDSPSGSSQGGSSTEAPEFLGTNGAKVYYMKNIIGLNNLVDSSDSNQIKAFVDYGKDFITLEFNEDVSQNIGYLASLYKSLSWSRINGKQIIPENLLRFDVDITITEIRKFNRVVSNKSNVMEVYKDLISKYTYTLYECQFFFNTLPHGDSVSMSDPKYVEKYDIKFNYKYSTMKFSKFTTGPFPDDTKSEYVIDNKHDNINKVKSKDTNNSSIKDNKIVSSTPTHTIRKYNTYTENISESEIETKTGPLQDIKKENKFKSRFKKDAKVLLKDVTNAGINEFNRQIITQAALLNRSLDNIRNAIPYAGRMSAPTNVYSKYNIPFVNDSINAVRKFVGKSVKGFFTNPD
jgi:hypothetical protein